MYRKRHNTGQWLVVVKPYPMAGAVPWRVEVFMVRALVYLSRSLYVDQKLICVVILGWLLVINSETM